MTYKLHYDIALTLLHIHAETIMVILRTFEVIGDDAASGQIDLIDNWLGFGSSQQIF